MYDTPDQYDNPINPRLDKTLGYMYFMDKSHPFQPVCGEDKAEVALKHANLCGDCAAITLRHELEDVFPFSVCGQPLFANGRLIAVCVMKYGEEHDHSRLG